jgi:hypothetical protein
LDSQGDREPLRSISIEGVSALVSDEYRGDLPVQGEYVTVKTRVHWRKGKPPLQWFVAWSPAQVRA